MQDDVVALQASQSRLTIARIVVTASNVVSCRPRPHVAGLRASTKLARRHQTACCQISRQGMHPYCTRERPKLVHRCSNLADRCTQRPCSYLGYVCASVPPQSSPVDPDASRDVRTLHQSPRHTSRHYTYPLVNAASHRRSAQVRLRTCSARCAALVPQAARLSPHANSPSSSSPYTSRSAHGGGRHGGRVQLEEARRGLLQQGLQLARSRANARALRRLAGGGP